MEDKKTWGDVADSLKVKIAEAISTELTAITDTSKVDMDKLTAEAILKLINSLRILQIIEKEDK